MPAFKFNIQIQFKILRSLFFIGAYYIGLGLCTLGPLSASESVFERPVFSTPLDFAAGRTGLILRGMEKEGSLRDGVSFRTHVSLPLFFGRAGFSSFATLSDLGKRHVVVYGSDIYSLMNLRSVSFGPSFKLSGSFVAESLSAYNLSFGPLLGLQTVKFKRAVVEGGGVKPNYKINYKSRGLFFALGRELYIFRHILPILQLELSYVYLAGYQVTVVGGTLTESEMIHFENPKKHLTQHALHLMLSFAVL